MQTQNLNSIALTYEDPQLEAEQRDLNQAYWHYYNEVMDDLFHGAFTMEDLYPHFDKTELLNALIDEYSGLYFEHRAHNLSDLFARAADRFADTKAREYLDADAEEAKENP